MDARSIALLEFPAGPRAARREDLVRPVAPPRRGPRAVDDPVIVAARPRRDRPGAVAAPGPGRRGDRRGARHRAVDRAARRAAAGSTRRSSSRSPRRSTPPRASRRRSPTSAGRCCATSGAALHPLPALRSTLSRSFDPVGRAAGHGVAAPRRAPGDRPRRLRPAAPAARLARRARSSAARSRSRSSRCATGATSCRSAPRPAAEVKGIVHDASGSGQTLFVEPLVVVELGNAWREAQAAVDEEVGRILDELSRWWAPTRRCCAETLEALAQFDFWAAKAQLAAELDGDPPAPSRARRRSCCSRRATRGSPGRVVPIDLRLGDGYTALVITGPNTGGKTVALRTLGLLALMHQAGLHVPAEAGSVLPVFRDVFADIGDEQSIAQSLSTFSGHLRSIIRIVEHAGPGHARPARRAGRRHGPDGGLGAGPGAARPLHPLRGARRRDDPLRGDQGLRARDAGGPQRVGGVRPRDAVADVPAHDRPPGRLAGVRDRGAARAARRRSSPMPASRLSENQRGVRGDARVDPQARRARSPRRWSGPGPRRPRADRGAPDRRGGAPPGPPGARRGRASRPGRGGAARRGAPRRRRRRPPPARARDRHRTGDRRRARARRADARPPARGAAVAGSRPPVAGRAPDVAARRPCPEPERWLGGPDRGAREGRHARDAGGGRDARLGRGRGPRAGRGRSAAGGIRRAGRRSRPRRSVAARARPGLAGRRARASATCGSRSARSVASSLDLRGARVDEALEALDRYLDDASLAGLEQVLIIHGLGHGRAAGRRPGAGGRAPAGEEPPPGRAGRGRRRGDDRPALSVRRRVRVERYGFLVGSSLPLPLPGPPPLPLPFEPSGGRQGLKKSGRTAWAPAGRAGTSCSAACRCCPSSGRTGRTRRRRSRPCACASGRPRRPAPRLARACQRGSAFTASSWARPRSRL